MRLVAALSVFALMTFLCLLTLTALACLESTSAGCLPAYPHLLALQGNFWKAFPSIGRPSSLVALDAFLTNLVFFWAILHFGRIRAKLSYFFVGLSCLAGATIPYIGGLFALVGNGNADYAYGWFRFMLLSLLYAAVLCALSMLLHLACPKPPSYSSPRVRIFNRPPRRQVTPYLDISTVYLSRWL